MTHHGPQTTDGPLSQVTTQSVRQQLHEAVARYHRPLVAYALAKTGNQQRAQDAAQDTLLRLCQQPTDKLQRDILPRLAPWLFTVCRNAVIDLHRKESRMTATDTHALDNSTAAGGPFRGPAQAAEDHDQQDHLLSLVASLPGNQREVVQLRFQGGLAYREIAEVTGHSVSHVGVLLHEAIKHLRQQLTALNA